MNRPMRPGSLTGEPTGWSARSRRSIKRSATANGTRTVACGSAAAGGRRAKNALRSAASSSHIDAHAACSTAPTSNAAPAIRQPRSSSGVRMVCQ